MVWLRSLRFDLSLQIGALFSVAPVLALYTLAGPSRAASFVPTASLIAIPFLHVFGSFFFAFSAERNRSAWSPSRLAGQWAVWIAALLFLQGFCPRALATFALLYGGWHILRQNFGFLREIAHRAGLADDRALRRLDLAACAAPAVALWLLIARRGPWSFIAADVYHPVVPAPLVALAFVAIPATILLRELRVGRHGRRSTPAALLLIAGNCAALLGPALLLSDLLLIYTLSASYHGAQYLAYLSERERERRPHEHPTRVLQPMASAIVLSMAVWAAALAMVGWLVPASRGQELLLIVWYAIVPFHYFVDGRIWRRSKAARVVV